MRDLVREGQKPADSAGDGILGEGRIRVLAQFLEGGLLVLQTQRASLEQVGRHVVPKNLESAFDAGTRCDGRAGGATQVRVVKVGQSVGASPGLAALAPLLPRLEGLGGAHGGDQRTDRVRIADRNTVGATHLFRAGGRAELARAPHHREGNLGTGARDLKRRRAAGLHEGAAGEERTAPDCGGLGRSGGDEHRRQAAHGATKGIDEACETRKLVGLMNDAHDVALATSQRRTGHHDDGGLGVVQRLQVGTQAACGHGRVKLGLDEDAPADEVESARKAQRRAYLGGHLGGGGDDGARELVLHV